MRVHALVTSLLVGLALHWAAPASAVDLSLEPSFTFVPSGQTTLVQVEVAGIGSAGLAAFQVEISFDPAFFSAADPNSATALEAFEPASWLLTSTGRVPLGVVSIDNGIGRIVVAYATEPGPALPTGSGPLAEIEFTALATGVSALSLDLAIVADGSVPPDRLPLTIFGASLSSDPAIGDLDGDHVPENADGLGLPGDIQCTGGNTANCDDNCPLLANTTQDDADSNGLGDACESQWSLVGTALGGSISFNVQGVPLVVITQIGDTAAQVASNLSAAINAEAALAAQGIRALASGGRVVANAPIVGREVDDLGFLLPRVPIPFTVGLIQMGVLAASGFFLLRRRHSTAKRKLPEERE